ncbi:response regulator transcription factor [Paenibacillus sp. Soil750]|uniref:response regulator transcription factor n=1 Tax=Paenibacillus sp. Soil750 TaxID=1736398 RepID=UPI000700E655|nr:helix-turn-helix domain-containing protein [Paenibacillus sp. Soil750]KRE64550.1 hypothetical protein ASL11_20945 [Paenibacillus sp. Soil750]
MKKVFLVDNDILFQETFREIIDWSKEGFIYSGNALDADVTIPLIEQFQPDILITDILMPFTNGLELSSIMRRKYPEMKIIIISADADFECARKALQIGVQDFCIKPIGANELLKVLRSVSELVDKERELKTKEQKKTSFPEYKLLNDLCSGFVTAAEVINHNESLELNIVARYYVLTVLDIRDRGINKLEELRSSSLGNELSLVNRYKELELSSQTIMFQRSRSEFIWIIKGDTLEQLNQDVQVFRDLQYATQKEMNTSNIFIGIGSVQDRLQNVHFSFLDAMEDVHWQRLSFQNYIALQENNSETLDPTVLLSQGAFIDFLKVGTLHKMESFVSTYAASLREINWDTSSNGFYILNNITIEAFRSYKEMYRHLPDPDKSLHQFQRMIASIYSWEEANSFLMKLIEQFWSWRSRTYDKYKDLITKVKEYVQANFDKDTISLQVVAEYVKLSPNYLSRLFSQETGQTFIEYLTQIRICKAKELLKSTSSRSYEIAFLVGYNDPYYFSNIFKRITGMTPKEFRNRGTELSNLI